MFTNMDVPVLLLVRVPPLPHQARMARIKGNRKIFLEIVMLVETAIYQHCFQSNKEGRKYTFIVWGKVAEEMVQAEH